MANFVKINKDEYKELLNKVQFRTFFHEVDWHEFLEKEFKWLKFEYYLYKDELLLSFGRVGDKLISLPFCEYGGPLPLKKEINFEEFEKDVLSEFQNIKIKFHPKVHSKESNIITYFIENFDKFSFRKTLRHEIRNAEARNLEIKKCNNPKELESFYNLYVASLKRKKTVPYPFSVIKFLNGQPNTEILLALYKQKIIAGSLFLRYDKFVHYFLSASDYKYRDFGANYLILWGKIKSLIGKDVILDLGASPKGSKLEIFKRGWGGTEYPIYQIGIKRTEEKFRSSKLRNIWGLLPNFVIKRLSRYLIKYRL
jgi:hypothetical protein